LAAEASDSDENTEAQVHAHCVPSFTSAEPLHAKGTTSGVSACAPGGPEPGPPGELELLDSSSARSSYSTGALIGLSGLEAVANTRPPFFGCCCSSSGSVETAAIAARSPA